MKSIFQRIISLKPFLKNNIMKTNGVLMEDDFMTILFQKRAACGR